MKKGMFATTPVPPAFTMTYGTPWCYARRNGTEWVDSCPLALAARMYRMEWKAMRKPRLGYQPPAVVPLEQPTRKYTKAEIKLIELHKEVCALIVTINAETYRDRLERAWWPNMQPPYETRWGIGGGLSVYPDVDGVGSWGRAVRLWEEGPTCGADCPLVAAARAMGEAGRTARPACGG
jgi:hypothetical protein